MKDGSLSLLTRSELERTTLARLQLFTSLRDPDYRHAFVEERVRTSVALQIRSLRDQRDMTQQKLAEKLGLAQTWISRLEDPEYGKMTVATLLRLAEAFDTDLEIKFRPFSQTIREVPKLTSKYFEVPSFDEEIEEAEHAKRETAVANPIYLNSPLTLPFVASSFFAASARAQKSITGAMAMIDYQSNAGYINFQLPEGGQILQQNLVWESCNTSIQADAVDYIVRDLNQDLAKTKIPEQPLEPAA